jgi:hypothetical protein
MTDYFIFTYKRQTVRQTVSDKYKKIWELPNNQKIILFLILLWNKAETLNLHIWNDCGWMKEIRLSLKLFWHLNNFWRKNKRCCFVVFVVVDTHSRLQKQIHFFFSLEALFCPNNFNCQKVTETHLFLF